MKILGLCGTARVGKDTAAANMPGWYRVAFADSLKLDVRSMLETFGCDLNQPEHKERARGLLVAYGALARSYLPDFWVQRLAYMVEQLEFNERNKPKPIENVVVTDLRYANEVAWVQSLGGKVVMIERPGYGPANHEEDRSFIEIAEKCSVLVVVNDSTPEALGRRVLEVTGNG